MIDDDIAAPSSLSYLPLSLARRWQSYGSVNTFKIKYFIGYILNWEFLTLVV